MRLNDSLIPCASHFLGHTFLHHHLFLLLFVLHHFLLLLLLQSFISPTPAAVAQQNEQQYNGNENNCDYYIDHSSISPVHILLSLVSHLFFNLLLNFIFVFFQVLIKLFYRFGQRKLDQRLLLWESELVEANHLF